MIAIEIENNSNCSGTDYQVFQEMGEARPIQMMKLQIEGRERICWVTGVSEKGVFHTAYAQKVADSGGGVSFLIFGGKWGIRFKPDEFPQEPWNLNNPHQWGEPFKFYGEEKDIVYAEN